MNIQQNTVSENNFEQCIKCTICTVYCPVAAVNPDYPGPKQAGPDGERLRLKQPDFFDSALKYCLNCKRCEVACPSNVRIGDIIQAARIKYGPKHNTSIRNYILANTDLVGTLATPLAPVVNAAVATKPVRMIMDKVMGIDHRRIFPKYSHGTFESWYRRHAVEQQASFERQVSYFHGCYVNYNNPQLGKDMIRIMNALGYGVRLLDKEKCCGVALISNGLYSQAKRQARTNMESIRTAVKGDGRDVITTSSTCTFTIRDEYPHLLDLENGDVRDHVELATRYIYRLINEQGAKLRFLPHGEDGVGVLLDRAAAHDPRCRGHGTRFAVLRHSRYIRIQEGELSNFTGRGRASVPPDRGFGCRSGRHRLRDLQVADRDVDLEALRASSVDSRLASGLTVSVAACRYDVIS